MPAYPCGTLSHGEAALHINRYAGRSGCYIVRTSGLEQRDTRVPLQGAHMYAANLSRHGIG